jgi:hypothetical protein
MRIGTWLLEPRHRRPVVAVVVILIGRRQPIARSAHSRRW